LGRVGPRGEEEGGRGGAEKTGAVVGGVKKHEFRLIEVNGEAGEGEPGPDAVPGGGEEGGTRGKDVAVVNVKGEVDVFPVIGGAEERGGGECGENWGEGGALRGTLIDSEGVRGVAVEGELDRSVGHETPDPGTGAVVDAEAGKSVDGECGVEVVKETRDIKKEDRSHAARLNGLLGLMTEGGSRIRGRVVCAGAELAGT